MFAPGLSVMEITMKNMDKSAYTKPQKLKQVSNHVPSII